MSITKWFVLEKATQQSQWGRIKFQINTRLDKHKRQKQYWIQTNSKLLSVLKHSEIINGRINEKARRQVWNTIMEFLF